MSTSAGRVLMIPKGDYDATATYTMLDVVSYQGKSYVAKQTTTGNAPTNTTYWQLMIDAQGHTIKDSTTTFPNRANLVFDGFYVEDDSTNNATIIRKNAPVSLVSWSTGTDAEIKAMVDAYYAGELTLADIQSVWNIGDEREVTLSAMAATGVGESHASQTVKFVLMNFGGKTLTDNKECLAIVGQKNSLVESGYLNNSDTNTGGWSSCARRAWCNNIYKAAIPSDFRELFKQYNNQSGTGGGSTSGTQTTADYFALPAEIEIFGTITYSVAGEGSQFEYYETSANRIKTLGDGGSVDVWWTRSPRVISSTFCAILATGDPRFTSAQGTYGLAPFGCI